MEREDYEAFTDAAISGSGSTAHTDTAKHYQTITDGPVDTLEQSAIIRASIREMRQELGLSIGGLGDKGLRLLTVGAANARYPG